jgi:hypothetical protein
MLGGSVMKTRALAVVIFLLALAGFVYVARIQAPPDELSVLRTLLTEWESVVSEVNSDLLATALLISNPSMCFLDDRPDAISQEVYESFLDANHDDSPPIRLSALTDFVSVVSYDEARRWQGNTHLIDVGDRSLLNVSRVGLVKNQALVCVENGRLGMVFLFERVGDQWQLAARHQAWIA